MKKFIILMIAILSFASVNSFACDQCDKEQSTSSFDKLKNLVGTWEGKSDEGGKEQIVKASYQLTSAGTALEEKIFIGTPHEMISIYYPDGKTVSMTHYCAQGNRPVMTLKKASGDGMFFEMNGKNGIQSKNEQHMHSLDVTWKNDNEITQNWTSFKDGKKSETASFTWKRVATK